MQPFPMGIHQLQQQVEWLPQPEADSNHIAGVVIRSADLQQLAHSEDSHQFSILIQVRNSSTVYQIVAGGGQLQPPDLGQGQVLPAPT